MAADNVHLKSGAKKYDFMAEETSSLGGIKAIQPKSRRKLWLALACTVSVVVVFGFGFLVGYLVKRPESTSPNKETEISDAPPAFESFHNMFKESISAAKLESLMRYSPMQLLQAGLLISLICRI